MTPLDSPKSTNLEVMLDLELIAISWRKTGLVHLSRQAPSDAFLNCLLPLLKKIRRLDLKVVVAGICKTIDNDIPVIDKAFGFDIAIEEAQRAINAAHIESDTIENGIGLVKLMGRYSASRGVDCCLIPESPFYLKGPGGLFDYIEKRPEENGHMVIVIADGAGQQIKGVGGLQYA
ncbi:hypothetical protein RHSIM_Rhsim02G0109700 [Rhododendron simsii]|uniref:Phosphofructokinase domain-containing protein n=1 Tax=Rhododendron simsii TaxID=118357 RepID=A0A834LTN9_RHOSS|nr:hypothetical protein RHSIM_Rhsim02G0109700 [Rhododendron simsii]